MRSGVQRRGQVRVRGNTPRATGSPMVSNPETMFEEGTSWQHVNRQHISSDDSCEAGQDFGVPWCENKATSVMSHLTSNQDA